MLLWLSLLLRPRSLCLLCRPLLLLILRPRLWLRRRPLSLSLRRCVPLLRREAARWALAGMKLAIVQAMKQRSLLLGRTLALVLPLLLRLSLPVVSALVLV